MSTTVSDCRLKAAVQRAAIGFVAVVRSDARKTNVLLGRHWLTSYQDSFDETNRFRLTPDSAALMASAR